MKSWQTNSLILLFFLGACSTSTPKLINKSNVSEQPDPEAFAILYGRATKYEFG